MDRKKPPALTSPWKIGFLVSLLLVTTSIGVGVLITRTFDLSWTWIGYTNGTWVFDKHSFMGEMLPLAVLVPLLSLFSYFLITGAVRKYKAYLDSGLDYKNLLQSLEKIDDLQDENKIKGLGNYPELKSFLLKTRDKISEREKNLKAKEKEISARMKNVVAGEEVKSELGALINAISKGPEDGFKDGPMLTLPEVKKVEEAIRAHLIQRPSAKTSMSNSDIAEIMENLRVELKDSAQALKEKFEYIAAEFEAHESGARDLEAQLGELKEAVGSRETPGAATADNARTTAELLERLEESSHALEALSEETKGVAINTALQAGSGQGGTTELIKLADDVRDLAAKFNGIAKNYLRVGGQLRHTVRAGAKTDDAVEIIEMVGNISNRIALWVERAVVLSSKLSLFKEHYLNSITALEIKLGGQVEDDSYRTVEDFGTADSGRAEEPEDKAADDFERQEQPGPFTSRRRTTRKAEPAGVKKEKVASEEARRGPEEDLFADIPVQETSGPAAEDDEVAVEIPREQSKADSAPAPADELFEEMDTAEASDEGPLAPSPHKRRGKPGEFIQSHLNLTSPDEDDAEPEAVTDKIDGGSMPLELESHRYESPRAGARDKKAPAAAGPVNPPGPRPEEEIFDLYELGAVDYQPDSVQHKA